MKTDYQRRTVELENKPDFDACMDRIYAWYNQEIIDRVPIRFSAHNAEYNDSIDLPGHSWKSLKERWWNTEYQIELFEYKLRNSTFNAETFPVFWPNLGPEVYTAFYGAELEYREVTSYAIPSIQNWGQVDSIKLDFNNPYFRKLEEMTREALKRCNGKYLVGYTDIHAGIDCAAAFRDPQQFCLDLLEEPEKAKRLVDISSHDFHTVYDYFDSILKAHNQLSVTWMGIPSYGKMHIPGCDFASMLSPEDFDTFVLPFIKREIAPMTHNVFHVDGKGVARHLDKILELPEINAIQWVQGMGLDAPIIQWVPLIKKVQAAGKSLVIDLQVSELESFMKEVSPVGILLCIDAEVDMQQEIIMRVLRWSPPPLSRRQAFRGSPPPLSRGQAFREG
ncbi:MAG: hypothetical protein NTV01_18090 [Bacteroidia bacterium]|nr:hypothetical protein [Bacteroidia bacterium]